MFFLIPKKLFCIVPEGTDRLTRPETAPCWTVWTSSCAATDGSNPPLPKYISPPRVYARELIISFWRMLSGPLWKRTEEKSDPSRLPICLRTEFGVPEVIPAERRSASAYAAGICGSSISRMTLLGIPGGGGMKYIFPSKLLGNPDEICPRLCSSAGRRFSSRPWSVFGFSFWYAMSLPRKSVLLSIIDQFPITFSGKKSSDPGSGDFMPGPANALPVYRSFQPGTIRFGLNRQEQDLPGL